MNDFFFLCENRKPAGTDNKPLNYRHKIEIKPKNRRVLLKCLIFYTLNAATIQSKFYSLNPYQSKSNERNT